MPADYTIPNIDAIQAGTATADTLANVANAARNAACSFFKAYPSVVIPNPAFDFLDATWDGLCKNSQSGLPPEPSPPFTGGQCHCTLYSIKWTWTWTENGVPQPPGSGSGSVFGEIGAPVPVKYAPNGNVIGYSLPTHGSGATGCVDFVVNVTLVGLGTSDNITSFNLTVTGGTPDNCGSLPPTYPPPTTPPVPIPPTTNTYKLPSVNLTFNNNFTWNVTPTLNLDSLWGPTITMGNLNISVGGGGLTISPPPTVSGPTININNTNLLNNLTNNLTNTNNNVNNVNNNVNNVNSNVNNVNSNVNNVNSNVNNVNNNVTNVNNNVNTVNNNVNTVNNNVNTVNANILAISGTLGTLSGNVSNILVLSNKINKNTKPTPHPSDTGITTTTVAAGTYTVTGLSNLISAQVILTTLPTHSELRFGADPTYNVYVAGFFAWLQGTQAMQRIPLQYANNLNFAPLGVDGYTYTLVNGAAGYSRYSEDNS